MAVLSFEKRTSKQGYCVSFFWLHIFSHEPGWNVVLVLAKTFLHWSQQSHLKMKHQRRKCVFCINLKNPFFYWIKSHLNTLFKFDHRQFYQKLFIIRMLGWKLKRFYYYFNLSPKIITWPILEIKNLLGLLFIYKITHPYIVILEIWLDGKAGKKLEPN